MESYGMTVTVLTLLLVGGGTCCNLPPSLWCSSLEMATRCKVVEQCRSWLSRDTNAPAPRVAFTVYLESLCPGCRGLLHYQLAPVYRKIGEIMDVTLVTYGNAQEKKVGDKWVFTCQHGPGECFGNLIEICVTNLYNKTVSLPAIFCMEDYGVSRQALANCAPKYRVDQNKVMNCVNGPQGNEWEHEAAVKTGQLDPPHQYTPWVTLNGVHTEKIKQEADTDLLRLICDTYTGKTPAACKAALGPMRCVTRSQQSDVLKWSSLRLYWLKSAD